MNGNSCWNCIYNKSRGFLGGEEKYYHGCDLENKKKAEHTDGLVMIHNITIGQDYCCKFWEFGEDLDKYNEMYKKIEKNKKKD